MTSPTQLGPARPWWLWPVAGFAAAIVVSVVAIVVADDDDSGGTLRTPPGGAVPETLPHVEEEFGFEESPFPDEGRREVEPDGDLEVVDQGVSSFEDVEFDQSGYSYAAVIDNPTDAWAEAVDIRVLVRDADGTLVTTAFHHIGAIAPGGSAALAGEGFGDTEVVAIEVQPDVGSWTERDNPPPTFEVSDIATRETELGSLETTALVSADTEDEVAEFLQVIAVYRDPGGGIVGGAVGGLDYLPPGDTARVSVIGSRVAGVASTDVFVTF